MNDLYYLQDQSFLKSLDNYNNKFFSVRIEIYTSDDFFIKNIEGRVQPGSTISINGSSSVRRTCNLTMVASEEDNDLLNIDSILSPNKRIKIFEGIRNDINGNYDDVIWFPLGVFIVVQPNISHTSSGCLISLSCKDKMCLLNGECGGGLPTSITFHEYDQIIGKQRIDGNPLSKTVNKLDNNNNSMGALKNPNDYTIYYWVVDKKNTKYYSWTKEYSWVEENDGSMIGERVSRPQRIYDIIQTLVCNYGGESLNRIFINDVPLELKQIVRYVGTKTLYYNSDTQTYTLDEEYTKEEGAWKTFEYNEDVGYVYTDFVYPGSLVSSIGENVCSVLDKIKNTLGNYEYFYDVEGNFIFQEIKNYLNNSYDATLKYRLDNNRKVEIASEGLTILDDLNYEVNFYKNTKSVYTFTEGNGLIASYNNSPNFNNIKNDYHIWGENADKKVIHYHVAIKSKPKTIGVDENDSQKREYYNEYNVVFLTDEDGEYTGGLRLAEPGEESEVYRPVDWRAELYLRGLTKNQNQQRPDIYEQELLDLFDEIYNFKEKAFKVKIVTKPNELSYFLDFLEPVSKIYDYSVDVLNPKVYSYQQNKIRKLYNVDIPNVILLDTSMDKQAYLDRVEKCNEQGQPIANVEHNIYSKIAIGTIGYTAQEVARDLIYQYTDYNASISITSVPIYYLDVNNRITVQDEKSNIYGDYIIHNITLPLDAGNAMSISASRALERL